MISIKGLLGLGGRGREADDAALPGRLGSMKLARGASSSESESFSEPDEEELEEEDEEARARDLRGNAI